MYDLAKWTSRLAFDVALALEGSGETMDEIGLRHGVDADDLSNFRRDRVFLRSVEDWRNEIRDKGLTFRLKARAQAEELLLTSWQMIHCPDISGSVRADLIKSVVRWAGLDVSDVDFSASRGGGVSININFGGGDTSCVVSSSSASGSPSGGSPSGASPSGASCGAGVGDAVLLEAVNTERVAGQMVGQMAGGVDGS